MVCFALLYSTNIKTKRRWGPARRREMERWSIVGTVTLWHCVTQLGCHDITSSYLQGEPRAQYLTDVRLDSLAQIIDDDTRWKSIQARRAGGGGGWSSEAQEDVLRAYQEDPDRADGEESSTEQVSQSVDFNDC